MTGSGLVSLGHAGRVVPRADLETGATLWQHALPFPGVATPMSFQAADGRQFVVIAAGGSILLQSPIGDALVASRCHAIKRRAGRDAMLDEPVRPLVDTELPPRKTLRFR